MMDDLKGKSSMDPSVHKVERHVGVGRSDDDQEEDEETERSSADTSTDFSADGSHDGDVESNELDERRSGGQSGDPHDPSPADPDHSCGACVFVADATLVALTGVYVAVAVLNVQKAMGTLVMALLSPYILYLHWRVWLRFRGHVLSFLLVAWSLTLFTLMQLMVLVSNPYPILAAMLLLWALPTWYFFAFCRSEMRRTNPGAASHDSSEGDEGQLRRADEGDEGHHGLPVREAAAAAAADAKGNVALRNETHDV